MSRSKEASAFSVESALVALESLMKSSAPGAADLLQSVRQTGEGAQSLRDGSGGNAEQRRRADDGGGVLRVVASAQGGDAGEVGDDACACGPPSVKQTVLPSTK